MRPYARKKFLLIKFFEIFIGPSGIHVCTVYEYATIYKAYSPIPIHLFHSCLKNDTRRPKEEL